jgi:hypothetical protein
MLLKKMITLSMLLEKIMKKITLAIMLSLLMITIVFAEDLIKEELISPKITSREIANSYIEVLSLDYSPATTVDLEFALYYDSSDEEWLDGASLDFPSGVTVNSAESIGEFSELAYNQETGDGITVTWGSVTGHSGYGAFYGSANFTVNVTISSEFLGDMVIGWFINGDAWGAEPNTVSGLISLPQHIGGSPALPLVVNPANNSSYVTLVTNLEWTTDENTTDVDVYFSSVKNDVTTMTASALVVDGQSLSSYQTPELAPLTAYYWRVVARNSPASLVTNGPVWKFTTEPAEGIISLPIGQGTTSSYQAPWNFYYQNSVSETIYLAEELVLQGEIQGLTYFNTFASDLTAKPVNIWIGETSQTDLSTVIQASELRAVFSGNVDFPSGQNLITIMFDTPYNYEGGNLVVLTEREYDTEYFDSNDKFFNTLTDLSTRTKYWQSDDVDLDPYTLDAGIASAYMPNVSFYLVDEGMGSVTGSVTDGVTGLEGVDLTITGTYYHTLSAPDGSFEFPHVATSEAYTLTASLHGYQDLVSGRFQVFEAAETIVNLSMVENLTVEVTGQILANDTELGLQAQVMLTGYENYEVDTDANGYFTLPEVVANKTYSGIAIADGYQRKSFQAIVAEEDLDLGPIIVNEYIIPAYEVTATVDGVNSVISWSVPGGEGSGQWVTKGGDDNSDGIGTDAAAVIDVAQMYTEAELADYQGMYIRSIKIFPREAAASYTLKVWGGDTGNVELYSQAITEFVNNTWNEYTLDSSLAIPRIGPIYIGYTADTPSGHPCGCDAGPAVTGGDLIKINGQNTWESLAELGLDYNWNLKAFVSWNSGARIASEERVLIQKNNNTITQSAQISQGNLGAIANPINSSRALESYNVYRFLFADQTNMENWTLVGQAIESLTYTDIEWSNLIDDYYQYAVKAVYADEVESAASLSNWIEKETIVDLNINVINDGEEPIIQASITLTAQEADPDGQYQEYTAVSNALGNAVIPANLGNYNLLITASGYNDYTAEFEVTQEENLEVTLYEMVDVTINVTSPLYGEIGEADITLVSQEANSSGIYYQYSGVGDIYGVAVISVNTGMYNIYVTKYSFLTYVGQVDASDAVTVNVELTEIAYPVSNVIASIDGDDALLTWDLHNSEESDSIQEGFEEAFPPADWNTIVTNVSQSWARYEAVDPVNPTEGSYHAGVKWDYSAQDEWLITNSMNCPAGNLTFDFYGHYGSVNGDNYYVKISTDGMNWTPLWNASDLPEVDNHYDTPVVIDLQMYYGQNVQFAWNFVDGDGLGLWYSSYIDNVSIGESRLRANDFTTVSKATKSIKLAKAKIRTKKNPNEPAYQASSGITNTREFQAYNVYRFLTEDQTTPENWTLVEEGTSALTYRDTDWATLPAGVYKFAVRSVYTDNNLSRAEISNYLYKDMLGNVEGTVMSEAGLLIPAASVELDGSTVITDINGYFLFSDILIGDYDLTVSASGFATSLQNITVIGSETIIVPVELAYDYDCPDPENLTIEITGNNANLSWDAVVEDNNGDPVSNVLYIIYSSVNPQNSEDYYYLTQTIGTFYFHAEIGLLNDRNFYLVKAYEGPGTEFFSNLRLLQAKKGKISIKEVNELIQKANTSKK